MTPPPPPAARVSSPHLEARKGEGAEIGESGQLRLPHGRMVGRQADHEAQRVRPQPQAAACPLQTRGLPAD
jgi:hypothetical protein